MDRYKFDETNHLHLFNQNGEWKPLTGTSSIGNVLAKPLTWWASGLAVMKFGWLDPKKNTPKNVKSALTEGYKRVMTLSLSDYAKLLGEAYKAHSVRLKDTAIAGIDLHAELERFIKSEMGKKKETDFDSKITPYIVWSKKNIKRYIASEVHCFDESPNMFVGGITDSVAELMDGKLAVIDFKSSKEAYTNQFIQAAGYALQINKNGLWDVNGTKNLMLEKPIEVLIVVPFGAEIVEPVIRYDVESYQQGFKNCVQLYRLLGMDK